MTARTGMAETRRRALIGAALREISDRGSLDVTVAQIASRAGVSSALAHHYFGAKDDLILATMRHLLAEFGAGVVAGLRRADEPARPPLGDHRRQLRPRAVPPRHHLRLADLLRLGALLAGRRAAAAGLPAPPALQPRARAEAAWSPRPDAAAIADRARRADRRRLPARGAAAAARPRPRPRSPRSRTTSTSSSAEPPDARPAPRLALDRRRAVRRRRRRPVRRPLPGDRRGDRPPAPRHPRRHRPRVAAARDGFAAWSATPPAAARPRPAPRRRPDPRPQPRARRARDPRHRQAALRDAGRRLGLRRRRPRMVRRASPPPSPARRSTSAATSSTPAASRSASASASAPGTIPSQIACWKAAPALACGNALIFKPSELTPLGALKLGEILAEAGLPAGAFSVVQGDGAIGAALTAHPEIAKVSLDRLGPDRPPRLRRPPPPA